MRSAQRGRATQQSNSRRPTQGQAITYLKQGTKMTTNNHGSLRAAMDLEQLSAELEEARADVTMLERLKSAVDRVKRLSIEHDKASAARDKAVAAEAKAKEVERFAGISNVRVTQSARTLGENVLRAVFKNYSVRRRCDALSLAAANLAQYGPKSQRAKNWYSRHKTQ